MVFPGNDHYPLDLVDNLLPAGFNILVFNYEGSYSSEGIFNWFNSMKNIDDAILWLKQSDHIGKYNIDTARIFVCGYTFWGSMVLSDALRNPDNKNIICIAGSDQSINLGKLAADSLGRDQIEKAILSYSNIHFDTLVPFHQQMDYLIEHRDDFDLIKHVDKLKGRNILFIAGWLDKGTIPEEHILPLYRKLNSQGVEHVNIRVFETGHQFNNCRKELAQTIVDWINKL